MKNGIIFMTALVPTIGHERLVKLAADFMGDMHGKLNLVVSSRSFEPAITRDRAKFFDVSSNIDIIDHFDDNAPQNPKTDEEWDYWINMIRETRSEYIFGSEEYGNELARRSGAQFIPVDPQRDVVPVKGSRVRKDILTSHAFLMPNWVRAKKTNYVFFGQESVGKSTMTSTVSSKTRTPFYHEWARPYLETVGSEVNEEKMRNIFRMQNLIDKEATSFPAMATFQDTDVLSTYGYMKLWDPSNTAFLKQMRSVIELRDPAKTEYMILSPDNVPFEPNELRYGGNVRETEMDFWVKILDEFGFKYHIIEGKTFQERFDKVLGIVTSKVKDIIEFVRD